MWLLDEAIAQPPTAVLYRVLKEALDQTGFGVTALAKALDRTF